MAIPIETKNQAGWLAWSLMGKLHDELGKIGVKNPPVKEMSDIHDCLYKILSDGKIRR